MRLKLLISIVFLSLFLVSISFSSALDCVYVQTSKSDYLPQETAQVEIDADLSRDLRTSDIFLTRGSTQIPVNIFLTKVTSTKYFAWFNFPNTIGDYKLKVRGTCEDGSLYVSITDIEVKKTISSYYQDLEQSSQDKFQLMDLEEHILTAGALIDTALSSQALSAFSSRQDSCINTDCSTKLTALTMISFKDSLLRQRMLDSLDAYQNTIFKGDWKLKINSATIQNCNLTTGTTTSPIYLAEGNSEFSLSFDSNATIQDEVSINLNCPDQVSANLFFSYKQFSKDFEISIGNNLDFIINNKNCWGTDFKTACDNEATAYALLSLAKSEKLDINNTEHLTALSWLSRNADSILDKASIYSITGNSGEMTWLLNSQTYEGWWPKDIGSYQADIESTSLVLFALKKINHDFAKNPIKEGEEWIKDQLENSITNKEGAFSLMFAFQSKDIEPLISIWPGFVKTESRKTFDLILQNKGSSDIRLDATIFNATTQIDLPAGSLKNIRFGMPLLTTTDGRAILENLELFYKTEISNKHTYYNIPVLIFTEISDQELLEGSASSNEQYISENEQNQIIGEAQKSPAGGKTSEINDSLLKKFKFLDRVIKTAETGESFTSSIRLTNDLNGNLEDVTLTYSSGLIGIINRIDPAYISVIEQGETKTITIFFEPNTAGNYNGEIIANAKYRGENIETTVPISVSVSASSIEETCEDLGGKICQEEGESCEGDMKASLEGFACCVPADSCKKKSKGKSLALIIILVVVILLIILLVIIKRKPKKEMKQFLKEASQQYEKKFQRPPSIKR